MFDPSLSNPVVTPNFEIIYDEDDDAQERAFAIASTCEADFARLQAIFSTIFPGTPSEPIVVFVYRPGLGNGGANWGYQTRTMAIYGTYTPPPPKPPQDPPLPPQLNASYLRHEYARFLFVAELAEILMDFTGYGWLRGDSTGEGLSIYLGQLLHPQGFYATNPPRVNEWLNSDRPNQDWVSKTDGTDQNRISHGCALLFLYYLVSQLGHPIEEVIRIRTGLPLSYTWSTLTGKPQAQAFDEFNGLINRHLPPGQQMPAKKGQKDNIFPLWDLPGRSTSITQDMQVKSTITGTTPEFFERSPGGFCPPALYAFFRSIETDEYALKAPCFGFLNAAVRWRINGIDLPVHGAQGSVDLNVDLSIETPDGKSESTGHATTLQYVIWDEWWNQGMLFLKDTAAKGNFTALVTAFATEGALRDREVEAETSVELLPLTFVPGEQFRKDRARCNPFFAELDHSLISLSEVLRNAKNRPDPPDSALGPVLEAAARVESALARAAHSVGITRNQLLHELRVRGALPATDPGVIDQVLRLIEPKPTTHSSASKKRPADRQN